jgi:hypothetical protein
VARSRNYCCHGNATVPFLCIVELHVTVSSMKPFSVAMETRGWFSFALLSRCKTFRTAANDINALGALCQVSNIVRYCPILSDINQIWSFLSRSSWKSSISNITEICLVGAALICTDWQTDMKKLIDTFRYSFQRTLTFQFPLTLYLCVSCYTRTWDKER